MTDDFGAILLCGGMSRRIGLDKTELLFGDQTLLEIMLGKLKGVFRHIILITNQNHHEDLKELDVYQDIYKNMGPLGGIHAGLTYSTFERNFVFSCDLPFIDMNAADYLANIKTRKWIVIPSHSGYLEPLFCIYDKNCLPTIEKILASSEPRDNGKSGELSPRHLFNMIEPEIVDLGKMDNFDDKTFFNINNADDYLLAKKIFESKYASAH